MNYSGIPIQLASDLHIEFEGAQEKMPNIERKAPIIALLGDIGDPFEDNYKNLLSELSSKFNTVIVIAGNHEFYLNEVYETRNKMIELCSVFDNVVYLENNDFVYKCPETNNTVRILGCTLWTDVPEKDLHLIEICMNDYRKIKIKDDNNERKLYLKDTLGWHRESVEWIANMKNKYKNEVLCVLSHHSPLLEDSILPNEIELKHAMGTNLTHLMGSNITFFGFGHTHRNVDKMIKGTRIVSNQLGYIIYNENTIIPYDVNKVFHIPLNL
jgi:predicted phosphodiesterase